MPIRLWHARGMAGRVRAEMTSLVPNQDAIDALERDPLRNIVLLKQLLGYPQEHVKVYRASGAEGTATLVVLDVAASPYDRQTYPQAALAAFLVSDHPVLSVTVLSELPRGVGIVFKLTNEADLVAVASQFPVVRRTAFVSFSTTPGAAVPSRRRSAPDSDLHVTSRPSDTAFAMFAAQGHDRAWLEPRLQNAKAFACVAELDGETVSACIAFDIHRPIWELGGITTAAAHRRKGLASRVVRTTLAELAHRGLKPRYQAEEHNMGSIRLARSSGLTPFLTLVHYAHKC